MARKGNNIPDGDQTEFLFDLGGTAAAPAVKEAPLPVETAARVAAPTPSPAVSTKPAPKAVPKPAAARSAQPKAVAVATPSPAPRVVIKPVDQHQPSRFETLLHAELSRIFNLCLRLTQDTRLADDLTQEVFVRAAKAESDGPTALWLARETVSIFRRDRRYNRPRRPLPPPISEAGIPVKTAPPVFELPDAWNDISAEHRLLLSALGSLDADDRVMIVLKDIEDRSYLDAGEVLDIGESATRSRVAGARERLHAAVRKLEDGRRS